MQQNTFINFKMHGNKNNHVWPHLFSHIIFIFIYEWKFKFPGYSLNIFIVISSWKISGCKTLTQFIITHVSLFDSTGGHLILYQHLFWFFGLSLDDILFLPGFVITVDIIRQQSI